jgi:acyl carrier protein
VPPEESTADFPGAVLPEEFDMRSETNQMTKAEFLKEIDAIIEADPGTARMEDQLASLPGWDSMAVISFIAMADEKLGLRLNIDRMLSCKTVADLTSLCQEKLV